MKKYEVTLFIMGLPYSEYNTRVVEIEANSQDEAEQKAHDWYIADGWGVYSSKEITTMTKREKIEELMEQFNSTYPNGDSFDLAEFMYDKGYVDGYEAEADVRDNEF